MSDVRAAAAGGAGGGGDLQRSFRVQDFATPGVIVRERSFMRSHPNHHNHHQLRDSGKRRSMILAGNAKFKPTLEIYRPPGAGAGAGVNNNSNNKLNVHAKEFTMARHNELQTSRSSMNLASTMSGGVGVNALQQSRSLHAMHAAAQQLQSGPPQHHQSQQFRTLQMLATANAQHQQHKNSHSTSHASTPRVTFKMQPGVGGGGGGRGATMTPGGLQRSKSLTSADTLATGMAALGLAADAADLGPFPPDVQENIDKVMADPNAVCARTLMSVVGAVVGRAAESPRYALPAARRCIAAVEREANETFLESLLNTCQQWYQERDKLLGQVVSGGRPRLMAFLSFLLEMYCQLRRRSLQQRDPRTPHAAFAPPARTLLTLICKCCEDCIRQPVPSASDTENLFFVLTYIGRDLEQQLPGELEALLAAVRDAFLNPSAAPSIRKTLLQLIELHASRWQLPGCAVLYYYPSSK